VVRSAGVDVLDDGSQDTGDGDLLQVEQHEQTAAFLLNPHWQQATWHIGEHAWVVPGTGGVVCMIEDLFVSALCSQY